MSFAVSDPSTLARHRPGERGYTRLLVALFAAGVSTFASLYSTQPLIGTLARHFSIPDAHAAWSVSVTTLLLGIGMVIAGPLSDSWGRTQTMKASLCLTALLGLASALAPNWPVLLALRALQGLALAGTPAVALVYLREEVDLTAHARATGLYIGGTAIGGMTGRLVAGAAEQLGGWRWAVGAIALLAGVCALITVVCLPAARHAVRIPASAPRQGDSPLAKAWRALRDPQLAKIYAVAGASMGAFVAVYNVLGLRLTEQPYGLSVFAASLVFCAYPLGSIASVVAGRMAARFNRRAVVLAGCMVAVTGLAVTLATPLPLVILGVVVLTIGFFAAHGVASGWAAAAGERRARAAAQASAFYLLAYYLGSSIFGALGTNIWTAARWPAVAAMSGGLMLLAALASATTEVVPPLRGQAAEPVVSEPVVSEPALEPVSRSGEPVVSEPVLGE